MLICVLCGYEVKIFDHDNPKPFHESHIHTDNFWALNNKVFNDFLMRGVTYRELGYSDGAIDLTALV